jgi:hypothetical protein
MGFLQSAARRWRLFLAGRRPLAFCTIATRSFLPQARVLMDDVARHHPGAQCHLLYVNAANEHVAPQLPGVNVLAASELVDAATLTLLRRRFTVAETCFALKAPMVERLFEQGAGRVFYLDSDLLIVSPFAEALAALAHDSTVLTPHLDAPIPEDGRQPTEATILRAGAYNLGFIAMADVPATRLMLAWWGARTRRLGFLRPLLGYQGDQNWMNLAPTLFDGVGVLRHPGYNIAYWNAHSRRIEGSPENPTVRELPVRFVHLSGFDCARPEALSRFQNRTSLTAEPVLAALVREYAARVARAEQAPLAWRDLPPPAPEVPPAGPRTPRSATLPAEAMHATLLVSPAPTAIEPGEELLFTVEVVNDSPVAWPSLPDADGRYAVAVSWRLLSDAGNVIVPENPRSPLPHDVGPGESALLDFAIAAPPLFGVFAFEFGVVQDGVAWFALGPGSTHRVALMVASLPPQSPPYT